MYHPIYLQIYTNFILFHAFKHAHIQYITCHVAVCHSHMSHQRPTEAGTLAHTTLKTLWSILLSSQLDDAESHLYAPVWEVTVQ